MQIGTQTAIVSNRPSKKILWTSYVLSAIPVLMLVFSAVMKLMRPAPVLEGFARLGIPEHLTLGIGILELAVTAVYVIPRTAVLGAILLAAYLGGATVTHLRVGEPFFPPVIFGIVVWLALYLRDPRLRELVPFRK